jgi:hypothetical protein
VSERDRKLGWLTYIVAGGTLLAAVRSYVAGTFFGRGYPLNSFLFTPWEQFGDYFFTMGDVRMFSANPASTVMAYTPVQHLVLSAFTVVPDITSLFLTIAVFLATLVFCVWRFLTAETWPLWRKLVQVIVLTAASYPVLFLLDRGNTELLLFCLVFWFLYFYKVRPSWLWIPILALAAAWKIYPALLFLVPLSDRKYRDTLVSAGLAVVGTVVSVAVVAWIAGRSFASVARSAVLTLTAGHGSVQDIAWAGIQHGHSLWGLVQVVTMPLYRLGHAHRDAYWGRVLNRYMPLARVRVDYLVLVAIVAVVAVVWILRAHRPWWQRFSVAVLLMILLPFSSHDYTLVYVYVVLAALFLSFETVRFKAAYTVLLGLLLVPLDWVYRTSATYFGQFARIQPHNLVSSSVVLYPLIICAVLVLIVLDRPREEAARGEAAA